MSESEQAANAKALVDWLNGLDEGTKKVIVTIAAAISGVIGFLRDADEGYLL